MGNTIDNMLNGPILNPTGVIKVVTSSAAEAEIAGVFTNMKEAVALRNTLEEMGHPQPPTPIQVDNSTACGIANDTIKQRRSKAIDMRFYWVQDRVNQKQFNVYWKPGQQNLADYVTKHHTAKHHQEMRSKFLHQINLMYSQLKDMSGHQTHCEGVLIPNSQSNLAILKQSAQNTGQQDRRTTDGRPTLASQNKHKRVNFARPKDPAMHTIKSRLII